jgi:hypothetical protein
MKDYQKEPSPIPNKLPSMWDLVIDDMRHRDKIGVETYGCHLQPFNGRKALRDAYYECLDMAVYLRQKIWEEENDDKSKSA